MKNAIISLLGVSVLAPLMTGCSGEYLMQRLEKNEGDGWIDQGDSCILVERGEGVSASQGTEEGLPEEFLIESTVEKGSAHVTVSTASESVVHEFDREYLRSGEETVTEVTTDGGTQYRVIHWGSSDCDVRSEDEWAAGGANAE